MTTHPSEYGWRAVAEVGATDDTTTLYGQGDKIYRIIAPTLKDGGVVFAMKAPGFPTMTHSGTLICRAAAAKIEAGQFVRVAPFSDDARRRA